MCKRQSPQSQITCSIGNSSQSVFDSLNNLMDEQSAEAVVFMVVFEVDQVFESVCIGVRTGFYKIIVFIDFLTRRQVVAWLYAKHQWNANESDKDADLHH